jgi:hypothetical protein
VVSHRYAAERAAIGTASRTAKVLVRLVLRLVGFGPRSTLIPMAKSEDRPQIPSSVPCHCLPR